MERRGKQRILPIGQTATALHKQHGAAAHVHLTRSTILTCLLSNWHLKRDLGQLCLATSGLSYGRLPELIVSIIAQIA